MKKNTKRYIYVVFNWGGEPFVYRSKVSLVNHLGKKNSRIVDSWFLKNWFVFINDFFVVKLEIPKMKSKIRK